MGTWTSVLLAAAACLSAATFHSAVAALPDNFGLEEATVAQLQQGMSDGKYTSKDLVEAYLRRIEALDKKGPALHAVLELNPDALVIAESLDVERRTKGPRGPLHGIPILIKDNIDTADRMMTTAGSLALVGVKHERDAFVVQRLREAGAVILGKTNLSEWANIRSNHSSSGWSGRGGQVKNPYALDRSPSGSSSGTGTAIAANLASVGIGTETDGSVVSPSSVNSLVGIKPTVGLVSRAGIIPISHNQDTAGPMCRTVADAAALLSAMAGVDPRDPATQASTGHAVSDYTTFLDAGGLKGARIGIVRKGLMGYSPQADSIAEVAIAVLKEQGAVLVDSLEIPGADKLGGPELEVLLYDLKADLDAYLSALGPESPVHSLGELIAWNEKHRRAEMPYFGQELFVQAEAKGPLTDKAYTDALAACREIAREKGIDAVMDQNHLDALFAPTEAPPWMIDPVDGDHFIGGASSFPAVAGYPHITVPAGYVFGLPVGVSFFGHAWSEGTLIKLAYAFEQATKRRRPPSFLPTADLSTGP